MSVVSAAHQDSPDIAMRGQSDMPTLRFITCGSVDDGKSTLIGRLLYDSKLLFDDQLAALESESKTYGTVGDGLDFALLVDGLQAEREQGITIDVAYRFFTTPRRRFIVADTPGHEQYTRNMATGASNAELAIVLVDARKGVVTQTRRHSYILALFGIRHVVLAVNKMDLVGYDPERFDEIVAAYRAMADRLAVLHVQAIPVSARDGDNIFDRSVNMRWYSGPTVLEYLETVDVVGDLESKPFRLQVQWVNRPNADFRGYSGRIAGGVVRVGDTVTVHPSARSSRVTRILMGDVDADQASAGDSVTLVLSDEIDVSRGNVLAAAEMPPLVADQLAAHILWFDDAAMLPGRRYVMKSGAQTAGAVISTLKHRVSVDTMEHQAATTLKLNEIGAVNLSLDRPMACTAYGDNRDMGGFILVDAFSHHTVAAGVIDFALRRASNVAWQELDIDKAVRARLKHQRPCVLWFTGLSGAGKSTVANLVDKQLCGLGRHTYLLDGDNIRHGLNRDLGFTVEARVENIRRVAEVAKLFVDAGLIVMVSLISPFRAERQMARELLAPGEFIEIHMATPLAECERRDPKGLYRRARAGQIPNFTGIDSPYEPPEAPEIALDTSFITSDEASEQVLAYLRDRQYV